jgi:NADH-quinone oxidoreductase subunit J
MTVPDTLFWFFSLAMLLSGVLVIVNRNPVNSAMCLVLLFVFMAGLFLLLDAIFLAVIQILVYAGAVMVLFLFVLMLLDIRASERRRMLWWGLAGGLGVAGALVWELATILSQPLPQRAPTGQPFSAGLADVVKPLFVKYMLPFEITALLLLVAMVGVVLLSKKDLR